MDALKAAEVEQAGDEVVVGAALFRALVLHSRRLAYIASHGEAWSQAVARGEHDDAITREVPRG